MAICGRRRSHQASCLPTCDFLLCQKAHGPSCRCHCNPRLRHALDDAYTRPTPPARRRENPESRRPINGTYTSRASLSIRAPSARTGMPATQNDACPPRRCLLLRRWSVGGSLRVDAGKLAHLPVPERSRLCVTYFSRNVVTNVCAGTKAAEHKGAILLSSQSHARAVASCEALGETLLVPNGTHFSSDIRAQFNFLVFKKQFPVSQQFWVAPGSFGACHAINVLGIVLPTSCARGLPVLCTQSAPFRTTDNQVRCVLRCTCLV